MDIRSAGRMPGCSRSSFVVTFARFRVRRSIASTSFVTRTRVSRYVFGAKVMNQSLYMSTERAMSSFQRCGLSRFTGIGQFRSWAGEGRDAVNNVSDGFRPS